VSGQRQAGDQPVRGPSRPALLKASRLICLS